MAELFDTTTGPRVFALPPGADFPDALIDGLITRADGDPDLIGRTEIFVNTQRMRRRLRELFDSGPARLVPRLRLVTELGPSTPLPGGHADITPLRRKLELGHLIRGLIRADPTLAPRHAAFELGDSLIGLMDEMQGEGLAPDALAALDIADASGHWQRSLDFINIVQRYFDGAAAPDAEARQRRAVEITAARWTEDPPKHPVIVAGSTGSRGATALFMSAVAKTAARCRSAARIRFHDVARALARFDAITGGRRSPTIQVCPVSGADRSAPRSGGRMGAR